MISKKSLLLFFLLLISYTFCFAQEQILYKKVDTTELFMTVYQPEPMDKTQKYPAMVFFFGGGWSGGGVGQFEPHAKYFAKRGIACFLADYRVKQRQQTTPFESLKDAKSAIRFIRSKAEEFQIDTAKIIGAGGSAGGHLAAASALVEQYNEETDDLKISCTPNALVLFNPVIDNGPSGYGFGRIGAEYKNFSPLHNIKKDAPPTIIFLGTEDKLIPVETVEYYKIAMERVESRCEVRLYEGAGHGFFNRKSLAYYQKTVLEADHFLQSLGYLNETPQVPIK